MHYAGMAAPQFALGSICMVPGRVVSNAWLVGAIAVFTLLIIPTALIASLYDVNLMSRVWLYNERLVQVNEKLRHESLQLEAANRNK